MTDTNGDTPMVDVTESSPEITGEEYKAEGNEYYKLGKYNLAVQSYTKAVNQEPNNATFLGNRAAAYMLLGEFQKALSDSNLANSLAPEVPKTVNRIQQAQAQLAVLGQAQHFLESKNAGMAINCIDRLERTLSPKAPVPTLWRRLRAEGMLLRGESEQAGKIAMDILRQDRTDVDALVLRGRVMYIDGDNTTAINHFQEALRLDPDKTLARTLFRRARALETAKSAGNASFKAGRMAEADGKYTEALEIDGDNRGTNAKLYSNRASCRLKLKRYADALADCEQSLELDPSYQKPLVTRAKVNIAMENYQVAIDDLKAALETSPEDRTLRQELRSAELELKKSQRKDYYKILGIEKDAGESEIKKAYRKQALVNHPDKNPDDPEAEARFKDVGEAYTTLSDTEKKYRYDSGADLEEPGMGGGGGMNGGMGGTSLFLNFLVRTNSHRDGSARVVSYVCTAAGRIRWWRVRRWILSPRFLRILNLFLESSCTSSHGKRKWKEKYCYIA